ncbi:hypothetical protein C2W62_07050 [Candidatus Entotheonella serta]|nr:hypothetical protein C2W62_07050 [Candidatus Entotheonella serta]
MSLGNNSGHKNGIGISRWLWDFSQSRVSSVAVYAAYMQMFWPLMFFASNAFVLKLWFLDRMVRFYEDNRHAE